MKETAIRFPATNGLFAAGPYLAGQVYTVPEDIAAHLVLRGAELVKPSTDPKKPDKVGTIGKAHLDHFAMSRAFDAEAKKRADEEKKTTAESAPATDAAASIEKSAAN